MEEEDESTDEHHHQPPQQPPHLSSQPPSSNQINLSNHHTTTINSQTTTIAETLINGDLQSQIQAAREIRRIIRSSSSSTKLRSKFAVAGVIPPLVSLLSSFDVDAREAAIVALLNLAVRNERNKLKIVTCGAIPPLVELLKLQDSKLPELATAAFLTLSSAGANKPVITSFGVAPLLVKVLISGSIQAKVDAVTALYNLSTCTEASSTILNATAVPTLINLLRDCKKHSKFAEKTTALLEIFSTTEEGRAAILKSTGSILTLVETVEDGSRISMEHAVGALLTLCQSRRTEYRELILSQGAIPGLLRLTVEGTTKAQERARMLLDMLRETPKENRMTSSVLKELVYDFATKVDGGQNAPETAQRLLQDMLHIRHQGNKHRE
ncbi:hypothetical protein RND81_09G184100 [Saponaria officinalis]|uniref:U-box domain-containing protein n=1 Tax=Saponaria officinalis TaxID=3572 RepID=A0AAW1IN21_SAPOF